MKITKIVVKLQNRIIKGFYSRNYLNYDKITVMGGLVRHIFLKV